MTGFSNQTGQTQQSTSTISGQQSTSSTSTPITEHFGRDITRLATSGKLDPVVGRENEVRQVIQILTKKKKNNAILIGPAGVGKTAIAELLAIQIANQTAAPQILDHRVLELQIPALFAGASMQGEIENRIRAIIAELELEKNKNVILFIDEVHLLTSRTGSGMDIANMLKPALARGVLKVIAATTLDEYREHIENDKALKRRFEEVMITEPTKFQTMEILQKVIPTYEQHHAVKFSDKILSTVVDYCARFITDRTFPDKALDIVDCIAAHVRMENPGETNPVISRMRTEIASLQVKKSEAHELAKQDESKYAEMAQYNAEIIRLEHSIKTLSTKVEQKVVDITEDDVIAVISSKTGIPISKISSTEAAVINSLEDNLRASIIGQDSAISSIVSTIKRAKAGLNDPKKPLGSLLFLGPTGVGKTEITKKLAGQLFLSEDDFIKLDMSEYGERHTVSALVGAPAGYVGYGKGGGLTEKVRRKPNSIILLDEIEKAHPDVHKLFLQVMDEGKLTDRMGNEVNFKNTLIIMTSNTGVVKLQQFGSGIGFGNTSEARNNNNKELLLKELKKNFPPEFLNRIDDVIVFNELNNEHKAEILEINLHKLEKQVAAMGSGGFKLHLTQKVKDFLTQIGYDPDMGARPLNRAITTHVRDVIATFLFEKQPKPGSKITVDFEGNFETGHTFCK